MRIFFILLYVMLIHTAQAQDVIVRIDGNEIKCKIEKVGAAEIEYRKAENPEGAVYAIARSEVFMLLYATGTRESITTPRQSNNQPAGVTGPVLTGIDSAMQSAKRGRAWGAAGITIGIISIAGGGAIAGIAGNTTNALQQKDRNGFNVTGGILIGLGIAELVTGIVGVAVSSKQIKNLKGKTTATLTVQPVGLALKF